MLLAKTRRPGARNTQATLSRHGEQATVIELRRSYRNTPPARSYKPLNTTAGRVAGKDANALGENRAL